MEESAELAALESQSVGAVMSYHPGMGKELVEDLYTDPPGFRACTGLYAVNLRATCLAADALAAEVVRLMTAAKEVTADDRCELEIANVTRCVFDEECNKTLNYGRKPPDEHTLEDCVAKFNPSYAALQAAALEVLRVFMPQFNDSRAVDDCLVALAAAVCRVPLPIEAGAAARAESTANPSPTLPEQKPSE